MKMTIGSRTSGTHHGGQFGCKGCDCNIFRVRTVMDLKTGMTIGFGLICASCGNINPDYLFEEDK